MESAYVLANRELEEIRTKNREKLAVRRTEVLIKAPKLSDIENNLMKCGTKLLECVLHKNGKFEDIKSDIRKLQGEKVKLLEANGFPSDYLDEIYSCNECRDTGYVDGKRCSCLKALIIKSIGANSNLTEHMRSQTFETFDFSLFANQGEATAQTLKVMRKVCEKAINFANTFDKTHENFLILGDAGTGKTFVSSCVANRALERGKTVYYQTAYRMFDFFERAKFGKDAEDEASETVKYIYDVDLLVLDDLGTEFATQFTLAAFFDVINSRIIAGKSTIISSNLSFESLSEIYSQRITSRFVGDYTIVQTAGKDLRTIIKKSITKK